MEKAIKSFRILTAGSCGQIEKFTNTKKPFRYIQFPAHFFLIQHHKWGYILVDTGYADYFHSETSRFPFSLYAKTTPVQLKKEDTAVNQLKQLGIEKEEINYVFITHFHADHVAGLKDFPLATFICSKAYLGLKEKTGWMALKEAFVPSLLPEGFENRVRFIEECLYEGKEEDSKVINDLSLDGKLFDVFGDGTMIAMNLPGHAKGQYGLFFEIDRKAVWLIADAVWDSDAYRFFQLPSSFARIAMDDVKMFQYTMRHLHLYHKKHPQVFLIPSHCRTIKQEWEEYHETYHFNYRE